jgi:protein TonB
MIFLKQILSGTTTGIFLSTLVHAGLGGGLYYTFKVEPPPAIVAELDLSMTSLLPAAPPPPPPPPPPAALGSVSVKQEGSASPSVREKTAKPERPIAPVFSEAPTRLPEVVELPSEETEAPSDEVMPVDETETPAERDGGEEEAVSVASVESGPLPEMVPGESAGTPEGAPGGIPGGDGVPGGVLGGEPGGVPGGRIGGVVGGQLGGSGRFLSASQVAQLPRWVANLIGPDDYPRAARRKGKDGQVLLSVFIDETGRVRDVRLMQGADEALNEVALRKVREARFTPAYDEKGEPVACKVTLPIRFHLE